MMARDYHQRPSKLLQIEDEVLAFDFDLCCTTRMMFLDQAKEKIRLDAMTMGAYSKALGGVGGKEYAGEITQDNFRDQGF